MTTRIPRAPLSERVVGYPDCAPQTISELVSTEHAFLRHLDASPEAIETAVDLRREVLEALRSMERIPLTSPEVVLRELNNRRIRPVARRWLVYALDRERKRRFSANRDGYAYHVSRSVPSAQELTDRLPLPEHGVYLVIYGQSPEVLAEDGAAEAVARLTAGVPVADVLFWHLVSGKPGTLYSLRRGQGDCAGQAVSFPDEFLLAQARKRATIPTGNAQGKGD